MKARESDSPPSPGIYSGLRSTQWEQENAGAASAKGDNHVLKKKLKQEQKNLAKNIFSSQRQQHRLCGNHNTMIIARLSSLKNTQANMSLNLLMKSLLKAKLFYDLVQKFELKKSNALQKFVFFYFCW